jgi:hypothetical protein
MIRNYQVSPLGSVTAVTTTPADFISKLILRLLTDDGVEFGATGNVWHYT